MALTLERIAAAFDRQDFERGRSYARTGKVVGLMMSADGRQIEGQVAGTRPKPYTQFIDVSETPRGLVIDGECTCPVGYDCKHMAAVLIKAAERQASASAAVAPATPPAPPGLYQTAAAPAVAATLGMDLLGWMDGLDKVAGQPVARQATPLQPAPPKKKELAFVVIPAPTARR
jgi:hypothetical protein